VSLRPAITGRAAAPRRGVLLLRPRQTAHPQLRMHRGVRDVRHRDVRAWTGLRRSTLCLWRSSSAMGQLGAAVAGRPTWTLACTGWCCVPECLTPETLAAGHRAHGHRSLPSRHGRAGSEFQNWCPCLLKVSGANELGEPNGEPTSTGTRPRQATSSHSRDWQMPHRATSSHVQRRYVLALQARGRWFEPTCAHCFSRPATCYEFEMIVREPNGEPKLMVTAWQDCTCRAPSSR
jgi:hypothetical protein